MANQRLVWNCNGKHIIRIQRVFEIPARSSGTAVGNKTFLPPCTTPRPVTSFPPSSHTVGIEEWVRFRICISAHACTAAWWNWPFSDWKQEMPWFLEGTSKHHQAPARMCTVLLPYPVQHSHYFTRPPFLACSFISVFKQSSSGGAVYEQLAALVRVGVWKSLIGAELITLLNSLPP